MLVLTSPAKTLDFTNPFKADITTKPEFLAEASVLVEHLRTLSVSTLQKLMGISEELATLNYQRFQEWSEHHTRANSRPAIVAYQGDIYEQLHEPSYTSSQQQYLQNFLRIISGLYGLLMPYDQIQPYRLEMKTSLQLGIYKNLYEYWGDKLTNHLVETVKKENINYIINLASEEYARAVRFEKLPVSTIQIDFRYIKNGKDTVIGLLAKKARGMMIEYMVQNRVRTPTELEKFSVDGYSLTEKKKDRIVFTKKI